MSVSQPREGKTPPDRITRTMGVGGQCVVHGPYEGFSCPSCRVVAQTPIAQAPFPDPEGARIAQAFHEAYEELAPRFGYQTRAESAVPWEEVPEQNRLLMTAVVRRLILCGTIKP